MEFAGIPFFGLLNAKLRRSRKFYRIFKDRQEILGASQNFLENNFFRRKKLIFQSLMKKIGPKKLFHRSLEIIFNQPSFFF